MMRRILVKLSLIFAFLVLPMSLQMLLQASPVAAQTVSNSQQVSRVSAQAVNMVQRGSSVSKLAADSPKKCNIGLYLISLHDFNLINKTFAADMWVWGVCPDPDKKCQKFQDLKTDKPMDFVRREFLKTEFVNANAVTTFNDLATIEPKDGGLCLMAWKVSGVFRQDWNNWNYPLDQHTLQIVMEDADDEKKIIYEPDTKAMKGQEQGEKKTIYEPSTKPQVINDPQKVVSGWRIINNVLPKQFSHHYSTTFGDSKLKPKEGSDYTGVQADIIIGRTEWEWISFMKLIAPALIAFLIGLASLLLKTKEEIGSRMTLLAGALFTVVVNMRVASETLGSSAGMTSVDFVHIIILIGILVVVEITVRSQWVFDRRALASGRDVQLLLPRAGSMQPSLLGAESKSSGDVSTANSLAIPQIPLFLVADVHAFLEEDGQTAFVGKSYPVHAGIAARKSGKEQASLLLHNMTEPLLFEASLHASPNIKLTTEWNKSLTYSPRHAESDVVEFRFEATAPEPSFLVIDFYQERHWFRTARIEFNAVGQSQLPTVTNKE